MCDPVLHPPGLRIKETKEVYEGEVTELTPCETENPMGGYGKTISHVIIGLKTGKGTKQLKVRHLSEARPVHVEVGIRHRSRISYNS